MIYISKNNGTKFAIIHIEINRGEEPNEFAAKPPPADYRDHGRSRVIYCFIILA